MHSYDGWVHSPTIVAMRMTTVSTKLARTTGALLTGLVLVGALAGCGAKDYDEGSEPAAEGADNCAYEDAGPSAVEGIEAPGEKPAWTGQVEATITTSVGDIDLVLDADAAPCTVNSFGSLAEQGYFDATTCHRIIGGFMLQCGDPTATGTAGPGYSYGDELTGAEEYPEGTLAMANSGPDTNGSQFFIVSGDASHLSGHTVFGAVTDESLEVVRKIDASWSSGENVPVDIETVTITS